MGGMVSSGKNNDELVDNLIEADCIHSKAVENVFRSVDRGMYYTEQHRKTAYVDSAWRDDDTGIHLSAPSIYAKVMEALSLKAGLSFLNMGSGTGYVSTMVGLLLGSSPTSCNHGVEFRSEPIAHAKERLREFILYSPSFDEYDFCVPQFIQGNCLKICTTKRYDRIYCGAECSDEVVEFVKSLMEVDGIAVVPATNQLIQITRTSESEYSTKSLASVSFAELRPPLADDNDVELPDIEVPSLKALCRTRIRQIFRDKHHASLGYLNIKRPKTHTSTDMRLLQMGRLQVVAAAVIRDMESDSLSSDDDIERSANEEINDMEDVEENNADHSDDSQSSSSVSSRELSDTEQMESGDVLSTSSSPSGKMQEGTTPSTSQLASNEVESSPVPTKIGDSQLDSGIDVGTATGSHSPAAISEDSSADMNAAMAITSATVSDASSESNSSSRDAEAGGSDEEHVSSSESDELSDEGVESDNDHLHQRQCRHPAGLPSTAITDKELETERQANRERAQEYHLKFSVTMRESVVSLPIPATLKEYLLYYRKQPN